MGERSDYIQHVSGPLEAKLRATIARLSADRKALIAALEPLALLAPSEDSNGVNMGDPLSKWFNVCHLVQARDAIDRTTTPAQPERGGDEPQASAPNKAPDAAEVVVPRAQLETLRRSIELNSLLPGEGEALIECWIKAAEQEGRA